MLFKNVFATLRKKWPQLVSIGLIVMLSAGIYTSMHYAVSSLEQPTLDYLQNHAQEEFSLEIASVLSHAESERLQEKHGLPPQIYTLSDLQRYSAPLFDKIIEQRRATLAKFFPGLELELREIRDFYFSHNGEDHRAYLLKDSERINRSYLEAGQAPKQDTQIALSRAYAQKNDLDLGDTLTVQGKDYEVCGFVLFPDYTYGAVDQTIFVDYQRLTFMLATDATFDRMQGQRQFRFAGRFADTDAADRWEEHFVATKSDPPYFITAAVLTENQFRSGAIFDELRGGRLFGLGFSLIIAGLALFIVALLIGKTLRAQSAPIGLLKALGYSRRKIAMPYLWAIVILALPMLLAGYFAGLMVADYLKNLLQEFYLLPSVSIEQQPQAFLTALLAPLFVFAGLAGIIAWRMLSRKPLDLLHPQRDDSVNRLTRIASRLLRNCRGQTKFTYLYVLQNSGKFFVFLVGIVFSSLLILIGLSMNGMVDRMSIEPLEKVDYQYEAHVDPSETLPDLKSGQEKFLLYPDALVSDRTATVHGILPQGQLYRLYDAKGNDITHAITEGVVVSQSLALKENLAVGEALDVTVGRQVRTLAIGGIAEDYTADRVFVDLAVLNEWLGMSEDRLHFSGIYAAQQPDDAGYAAILAKQTFMDEALKMQDFFQFTVYLLVGTALMIAVLILLTLSSMTIEDNHYNISLLKVMGYSRREVNAMVLRSYLVYMLGAYLFSLPLALLALHWTVNIFAASYDLVFPLTFEPWHAVFSLALIVAAFFAGTAHAKAKIRNVPLQEMLKTYAE